MAVILAFVLVLWAWGRFGIFALRTGHGNGSKIDFCFDAYFSVAGYPRTVENIETLFRRRGGRFSLHNRYYRLQAKTMINKGFYVKAVPLQNYRLRYTV
ncbi:MAG: hypothetical protein ACD_39C01767G0002 [uncultured bacterium]|nr:MAG: hypothetical protein ACD_39C01767G0002 [uncultured bacterium]